jgi:transposase-like protein
VKDRVVTVALMIAHGVNGSGTREILAVEPMFDESGDSWRAFFRKLKKRGLRRVCLCVSDAHSGLQAAVKKELLGSSWQRCKVHFMRNILFAAHLKQIWLQPDRKGTRRAADQLAQDYGTDSQKPSGVLRKASTHFSSMASLRLTLRSSPRQTCRSGPPGKSVAEVG